MRLLLTFSIFLLWAGTASAEQWEWGRAKNNSGAFLLGFTSGYAVHELGHIIAAEALGFDTDFDGPTIIYPEAQMTDAEHLQVASAGFQAQWLVSEAALRYREHKKLAEFGDSFNAGLISSHLLITAAYMTVLMNHQDGDLQGASEATGISNDKLAALVAIPAILDTWRLFGKEVPEWVPALSVGAKGVGITMIWTY